MDLTGKLLAAMPGLQDPRFDRALILICAHSAGGAMGLIVNHALPDLPFGELILQLGIKGRHDASIVVHYGGPVERGRGFILHQGDYASDAAVLEIAGGYKVSATLDVLEDMAQGMGPQPALLVLGYAGWGPGQLEAEIAANAWLTLDGRPEIVFSPQTDQKWTLALQHAGINPLALSGAAGHA